MDVYQLVPTLRRRWQLAQGIWEVEVIGLPICLVREVGGGNLTITSNSPEVDEVIEPNIILDMIKDWKQGWFWRKFEIIGDLDWLIGAIAAENYSVWQTACI
jgi:hypothetical protein